MPSVETANTASAAQTSAAGSRMLGFYLGGGGVKVDCLFDTANFLTKNAAGALSGDGAVIAGSTAATNGSLGFAVRYSGDHLVNTFGGMYSSAATALGFAVKPRQGATGWVSSAGNANWARAGISLDGNAMRVGFAGLSTTAIDAPITLTEMMTLLATGNLGIGTIAPTSRLHVLSTAGDTLRVDSTKARGTGGGFISFADTTGRKSYVGYGAANDGFYIINDLNAPIYFGSNGATRWQIDTSGHFLPTSDNSFDVGSASFRGRVAYFATGTINTSDEREKTWRGAPNAAELSAARRIAAQLGFYQWNDAITEKGEDGARLHFGVRAQAVWAIMADEGLIDPIVEGVTPSSRYAFLCYDEWPEVEAVPEERDGEGNITVAAVDAREAGNRFGIRPDQLALFLIAAQEARLAALEAA